MQNLYFAPVLLALEPKLRAMNAFKICTTSAVLILILQCCTAKPQNKTAIPELDKIADVPITLLPDSLRHLVAILEPVFLSDQKYRWGMHLKTKQEQAAMFEAMQANKSQIAEEDKRNTKIVTEILDKYGFLSYDQVGIKGSVALFSVVQHSDLATQKKYLPLFRQAVDAKKLLPSQYAPLADRIAMKESRPQRYGSQIIYVNKVAYLFPLENMDSVDNWRKEIRLEPIATYIKRFGLEWGKEQKRQKDTTIRQRLLRHAMRFK